eukprot:scaffold5376_cov338-Prasinococcus_capsulatus_cf.AAC.1
MAGCGGREAILGLLRRSSDPKDIAEACSRLHSKWKLLMDDELSKQMLNACGPPPTAAVAHPPGRGVALAALQFSNPTPPPSATAAAAPPRKKTSLERAKELLAEIHRQKRLGEPAPAAARTPGPAAACTPALATARTPALATARTPDLAAARTPTPAAPPVSATAAWVRPTRVWVPAMRRPRGVCDSDTRRWGTRRGDHVLSVWGHLMTPLRRVWAAFHGVLREEEPRASVGEPLRLQCPRHGADEMVWCGPAIAVRAVGSLTLGDTHGQALTSPASPRAAEPLAQAKGSWRSNELTA